MSDCDTFVLIEKLVYLASVDSHPWLTIVSVRKLEVVIHSYV